MNLTQPHNITLSWPFEESPEEGFPESTHSGLQGVLSSRRLYLDSPLKYISKRKERSLKKLISIMLVFVVSLSLAGAAMPAHAKSLSPPATLCLGTDVTFVFVLSIKPGANIRMLDGVQSFYSIQGALIDMGYGFPLVGAGYTTDGNKFYFTLNSAFSLDGEFYSFQAEGRWNIGSKRGMILYHTPDMGNEIFLMEQVPCTDYEMPEMHP